jgi:hypothetical protein
MVIAKHLRGWVIPVLILAASAALAQNAGTSLAVDPCKPATLPSGLQREQNKTVGKLTGWLGNAVSRATGGNVNGSDLGNLAGSISIKPAAPCPTKPLPPVVTAPKELCPPNTSRIEGQPYCITAAGDRLVEVIRVPAAPLIPAPANASPSPVAR